MADNVVFQSKRAATPPKDTTVAAVEDHNGALYQRFWSGVDRGLLYYDGSDNIEYVCKNTNPDAATSDEDWMIAKFTYDVSDNITGWTIKEGSVDGRAALFA
jgi:hypothetical protein